jgi:hypothetical protein
LAESSREHSRKYQKAIQTTAKPPVSELKGGGEM